LGWPNTVSSEDLYQAYIDRATRWGERRRVSDVHFGREIRQFTPAGELDRVRMTHKVLDNFGHPETQRVWGYRLPSLADCRKAWDEVLQAKTKWPEQDAVDLARDDVPF
jgi:hypothetical protein